MSCGGVLSEFGSVVDVEAVVPEFDATFVDGVAPRGGDFTVGAAAFDVECPCVK
jgi:hypothetical protein